MPLLLPRVDLAVLHELAEELVADGDAPDLPAARARLAREYGFADWRRLELEVERREILNARDLDRLATLLVRDPELAAAPMRNWCDHRRVTPLAYTAMLRFDAPRLGLPPDLDGTGALARALIEAGAPVEGDPEDREPPLVTAASYGDAEVARVLLEAGADVERRAQPESGGVPGGSALLHAAVFGMTEVLDVLVAAGARVESVEVAAAVGDLDGWLTDGTPPQARIRALVMAADHERVDAIDRLVAAGTPIDAVDEAYGRQALRSAAASGRVASVRRLLELGADPTLRDDDGRSALDLAAGHPEVEEILRAAAAPPGPTPRA